MWAAGIPRKEPAHSPVSPPSQMLLGYANATQQGFDFLRFLDDELTYKTLFVPVNEGFVDNMVRAGPCAQRSLLAPSGWPNPMGLAVYRH